MQITKEVDITVDNYEVEIDIDVSDIIDELDSDDAEEIARHHLDAGSLVDMLTSMESYNDLAQRCYDCGAMYGALVEHEEAPKLAAQVFAEKTAAVLEVLRSEYPAAANTAFGRLGGVVAAPSANPYTEEAIKDALHSGRFPYGGVQRLICDYIGAENVIALALAHMVQRAKTVAA